MPARRVGLALCVALPVALGIWGTVIEPLLIDERHETAVIPNLPPCWAGERVALISDLQVGTWLHNVGTIRRIVARLVAARPAAVLVAGDFVFQPLESDEELEEVREEREPTEALRHVRWAAGLLAPLSAAGIPTIAVLGNHDYAMDVPGVYKSTWLAGRVRAALAGAGIRVLHNTATPLPAPSGCGADSEGDALYVVGIGPHLPDEDRPLRALRHLDPRAPRIVLMHNPDSFAALPADSAPLALAGHTHGGQIRLPFLPHWSWRALRSADAVHTDGWIEAAYGRPGNTLYVNRGIGFSDLPIRLNCAPELTYFALRGGTPGSGAFSGATAAVPQ